ncbi:MFS transporter [Gudongella sp. DL1XJH-153]|uniref:MFS transporter n=1 Tax=Gudongella sp. DL1XJH-153 TaxID=3409804 RepID=UPI003BB71E79
MSELATKYIEKGELKNIVLFSTGKSVSMFASSIYSFAIGLYVLNLTGSALNYATTIMLHILPMIIMSPIAGVLADKISKRNLIVGMDLANGVLFLGLYRISLSGGLNLTTIYLTTILLSIFSSIFNIAFEAAKPNLVKPGKRLKLNSIGKLIDSSTSILGPALGGVMFAVIDIQLFILINCVSFFASAVSEIFINYEFHSDQAKDSNPPFVPHMARGAKYMLHSKVLKEVFMLFVILNFLLGFSVNVPMPYIINELLKLPPELFGLINAMFPIGLIIGTLTIEKVLVRNSYSRILIFATCLLSLLASIVGFPLLVESSGILMYGLYFSALSILMGIAISYVDIPIITIMQDEIPSNLRGVVFGLTMSLVKIVLPISLLVSGYLVNHVPVILISVMGGALAIIYPLHLLVKKNSLPD